VMNICVLPYALTDFVGTWAMPVGTPHRFGSAGNQATCTAQGFLSIIFSIAVPYYYSSLSIYSCFAVRSSFKEDNYRQIERRIHFIAICMSIPLAIFFAVKEFINPGVTTCFMEEYPLGCIDDPPCERGGDTLSLAFKKIYSLVLMIVMFVVPTSALLWLRGLIMKVNRETNCDRSVGKKKMIESYRKRALKNHTAQSGLYLLAFWSTHIIGWFYYFYEIVTGNVSYNLTILSNCCFSFQGVVLMLVYFRLEAKKGVADCKVQRGTGESFKGDPNDAKLTVADIRYSITQYTPRENSCSEEHECSFNIFDGQTDGSSPWAKFLDPDEDSEDDFKDDDASPPDAKEDLV